MFTIHSVQNSLRFFLLFLGLAFNVLSYGHTSYPQEISCPVDGKKFTVYVTGSYTTFKTLKDFQKQGAIGDLYESYINSCPSCHYCGYVSDFDTTFNDTTKVHLLKIIEPYKSSKMDDILENEIAVELFKYFNRSNDDIANLYLVASYLIKTQTKQVDKRKELQRNGIAYLEKAIANKEYPSKSTYATIQYLIGDLYRRVGDFDNAIKYFDLALANESKKEWVSRFATEQKELALKKDDDNTI